MHKTHNFLRNTANAHYILTLRIRFSVDFARFRVHLRACHRDVATQGPLSFFKFARPRILVRELSTHADNQFHAA